MLRLQDELSFAFSETSGVLRQEDEPCSGRHAAKKRAVERARAPRELPRYQRHQRTLSRFSITHDDHKLITNAAWKYTGRSQIQRAGSHPVQALREQRIEEQELALDRGDREPSVRATRRSTHLL